MSFSGGIPHIEIHFDNGEPKRCFVNGIEINLHSNNLKWIYDRSPQPSHYGDWIDPKTGYSWHILYWKSHHSVMVKKYHSGYCRLVNKNKHFVYLDNKPENYYGEPGYLGEPGY